MFGFHRVHGVCLIYIYVVVKTTPLNGTVYVNVMHEYERTTGNSSVVRVVGGRVIRSNLFGSKTAVEFENWLLYIIRVKYVNLRKKI